MTERKNIKLDPETFDRLEAEKRKFETWDGCINRVLDELEKT